MGLCDRIWGESSCTSQNTRKNKTDTMLTYNVVPLCCYQSQLRWGKLFLGGALDCTKSSMSHSEAAARALDKRCTPFSHSDCTSNVEKRRRVVNKQHGSLMACPAPKGHDSFWQHHDTLSGSNADASEVGLEKMRENCAQMMISTSGT